jgi:hypothetical protein
MIRNLLPVLAVFALQSCDDGKLTTRKAASLIKESGMYPRSETAEFEYGIIGYRYDSLPAEYYKLQEQGAFKIKPMGTSGLFTKSYVFNVELTELGKSFLVEEDKQPTKQGDKGYMYRSQFKTCDVNYEKTETVYELPAFNSAEVSYVVKRHNFTPFWYKYYDEMNHRIRKDTMDKRKTALFKTDKGWSFKK